MRAGEPGLRLSAKHGFVEAAGLKTIGLDLALVADAAGVGDALVNAILALPRKSSQRVWPMISYVYLGE